MPALDAALALRGPSGAPLDASRVTALNLRAKGVNAVVEGDGSVARACPALAKLDLADNVVRDRASIRALAAIASLKNLNLANNGLEGDALAPFAEARTRGGGGGGGGDATGVSGKKKRRRPDAPDPPPGASPHMRVLCVSGNRLTSLEGVQGMPALAALIANDNAIASAAPLEHSRELNTLVLGENAIESFGASLDHLTRLTKLSASRNALVDLGRSLRNLRSLRELRVARNRLKALPPDLGATCPDLRVLDASHNAFAGFGDVAAVAKMGRLEQLTLRGSPLSRLSGYDATVAKMCAAGSGGRLKTLDGRAIGPRGWKDPPGASKDDRDASKEDRSAEDRSAFAAARRAAGLDPLEDEPLHAPRVASDPEEGKGDDASSSEEPSEDDEMDEEERRMTEEVRALRGRGGGKPEGTRGKGSRGKSDPQKAPSSSSLPGAPGTSFLQELVAVNVGKARDESNASNDKARSSDDAAPRNASGVVKIVEVREGAAPKGVSWASRGRAAIDAMASGSEHAWAAGGWGDEVEDEDEDGGDEDEDGGDRPTKKQKNAAREKKTDNGDERSEAAEALRRAAKKKRREKKHLNVRRYAR
jgi:hypothetical protein